MGAAEHIDETQRSLTPASRQQAEIKEMEHTLKSCPFYFDTDTTINIVPHFFKITRKKEYKKVMAI